jgi:hypothetical protein
MSYPSVCRQGIKILLMQSHLLMWQKIRMQQLRSDDWDQFLERWVTSFCINHNVPALDGDYVPYEKSVGYV